MLYLEIDLKANVRTLVTLPKPVQTSEFPREQYKHEGGLYNRNSIIKSRGRQIKTHTKYSAKVTAINSKSLGRNVKSAERDRSC